MDLGMNVLWLLDTGLANVSAIYINVLFVSVIVVFCFIRYQKDEHIRKNIEQAELTPLKHDIAMYYEQQLEDVNKAYRQLKWKTSEGNDELLAWVHEMKSPLTALKLMIDTVPSHSDRLKLEQEWLRIYMLLDQQLHITRLQTIQEDSRLERLSLDRLVVQEVKALRSWCLEKGIGIQLEELEKEVVCDAKWLAFIIRQYLSNAVKYSPVQSEIVISTGYTEQGHLLLKVSDYGDGITAQDLPRIFKKSYTGTKGRESSVASGMGLYLAKQAADSIGLKLYVQSDSKGNLAEGRFGTTAIIQFPLENEYTKQFGM